MAVRPVVLAVLDGWGVTPPGVGNAIDSANTPVMDMLSQQYPSVTLKSYGEAVGLPWQEMGNSEVGHLNMGAGRIVYQDLVRINKAIDDGSLFQNEALRDAMEHVQKNGSSLHVVGCTSEGGIHGHIAHGEAVLEMAHQYGLKDVYFHAILDGRDAPQDSGIEFVTRVKKRMKKLKQGGIATLCGRFYAMDRDNRWERTGAAYTAMALGEGKRFRDPIKAVKASYADNVFDEQIEPIVIEKKGKPLAVVKEGDAVIFFNFRSDRAKQLTKAFVLPGIDDKFGRKALIGDLLFVTFTEYDKNLPVEIAFPVKLIRMSLGEALAKAGKKQFRIAETEKFAHVTVFFSAGEIDPFEGEDRLLVPSPPVKSYDEKPEMSAELVTRGLLDALEAGVHDFYLVNYANADMVGHTAKFAQAVQGIEKVDACIGQIWEQVQSMGGALLITADHGNAEVMKNLQSGEIDKEHTANPVPFIMAVPGKEKEQHSLETQDSVPAWAVEPVGVLADVAPTVLQLMDVPKPEEMTGVSLLDTV